MTFPDVSRKTVLVLTIFNRKPIDKSHLFRMQLVMAVAQDVVVIIF